MKLYLGVNSDGSEIISKQPIKRFYDSYINCNDVFSFNDTKLPPHWILDYDGIELDKFGDVPIDKYITLPRGSIEKMFDCVLDWESDYQVVEL